MPETRTITASQAIQEATIQMMHEDKDVYLMGEGITDPKRIFGTTTDLVETFGPARVIEMPIAENGLTGIAIGSAMMGRRPVMIHQRVEFALLALEQIFNNAAKAHYVTDGLHKVPMVIRMIIGRGWGQGPAHSQVLDNVFAAVPGLKVAIPSTAKDAKGMLVSAIRDDNPVLILEHRWFHYVKGDVPETLYEEPLSGARVIRSGRDVTVVSSSYMVYEALAAAEAAHKHGIEIEVLDLRMVRPLPVEDVMSSVEKTGHLICVESGFKEMSPGGEIIASLAEKNMSVFKKSPLRIGMPGLPTPSSRSLAQHYYPTCMDIIQGLEKMGVPKEKCAAILQTAKESLPDFPNDVPNPQFKGPF